MFDEESSIDTLEAVSGAGTSAAASVEGVIFCVICCS